MLTLHAACRDGLLPASWTTFFNHSKNAFAMFMKLCPSEQNFFNSKLPFHVTLKCAQKVHN